MHIYKKKKKNLLKFFCLYIITLAVKVYICMCGERERERRDLQHLADIASAKDFVNNGKLVGVVGREVRGKDAVLCTAAAQQLAGGARRTSAHFGVRDQKLKRKEGEGEEIVLGAKRAEEKLERERENIDYSNMSKCSVEDK